MFTGLIHGKVMLTDFSDSPTGRIMTFQLPKNSELELGSSISINGVCLTVSNMDLDAQVFDVFVMGITLSVTNLSRIDQKDYVNFELPLKVQDRLDGHLVQGHIDGVAQLEQKVQSDNWVTYRFSIPVGLQKYLAKKGSVALNGVSLTVSDLSETWFEVSLIPTTLQITNLGYLEPGDLVNVEVDIIAKYVENILRNT